jgi:protein-S-isoprenylcysteine O-methyltransferase Ste14
MMDLSKIFLALAPIVIAIGVLRYRSDYRRVGRTTALGLVLLVAAWAMPHLVLGFSGPSFPLPRTPLQWIGYGLAILGVALLLVPFCRFTPKMNLGIDTSRLITSGIYRLSRNPQYTGYVLFPVGYALVGQRLMAFAGVALYVVVMHLTVLVEEEHLERCFGDEYRRYKDKTPRYFLV